MTDLQEQTRERVAAAGGWSGARVTPALTLDDVTRDLGDREYAGMLRDAQAGATVNAYVGGVLAHDPQLVPAITDKDQDGYDLAAEIASWIGSQIEDMDAPIFDSLWDITRSGLAYGCKIAEIVLRQDRSYTGRTQVVLHNLKPKPRHAAALGIDPFWNVQSVYASVYDPEDRTTRREELPKEQFLIYSFRPEDADPRGSSILRLAYVPWDLKMKTWPEYYKYLVQFASPSLVGIAAEGAMEEPDPANPTQMIDAVTALLYKLMQFQNGSAIALANGGSVDALKSTGEGGAFLSAFELYNREMTTGIVTAVRAIMEAQFGSRADSETSSDVVETFIRLTRLSLERAVRRSALMRVVRLNYGEQAVRLTPYLSLGGVAQEDVMALMNAVANLARAKYFDPSQLPELDARLGLATRTPEEVEARTTQPPEPEPVPDDERGTDDRRPDNNLA